MVGANRLKQIRNLLLLLLAKQDRVMLGYKHLNEILNY